MVSSGFLVDVVVFTVSLTVDINEEGTTIEAFVAVVPELSLFDVTIKVLVVVVAVDTTRLVAVVLDVIVCVIVVLPVVVV